MNKSTELITIGQPGGLTIRSSYNPLTRGQEELLKYMGECIKKKKPMEIYDIAEIYRKYVVKVEHNGRYIYGAYVDWNSREIKLYKAGQLEWSCKAWFRMNLGSLILKEKLIVIPVINI